MMDHNENCFDNAVTILCGKISKYLKLLPNDIKSQVQEVRLRINQPISLCCGRGIYFVHKDSGVGCIADEKCVIVTKEDMEETFHKICSYSVYSYQNEIKNGYITIRGGHRVGICGTAVRSGEVVSNIKDISSFNIRIARQVTGCANDLMKHLGNSISGGLLIAGSPSSGKTTILRDIVRQLSCGTTGDIRKVVLVDERGELAGTCMGIAQNDLGPCCDVLDGYPKGEGIMQAVRSLSPEFIVCDELGGNCDVASVEEGLNAGVAMVASIHAGSRNDLLKRKQVHTLLATGAFETVILLAGRSAPGKITGIYKAGDLLAEMDRDTERHHSGSSGRVYGIA